MAVTDLGVSCCFCGNDVEGIPPDICVLTLSTSWQSQKEGEHVATQDFYCHAACFRSKLKLLPGQPFLADLGDD
jgi:hypothetical protein